MAEGVSRAAGNPAGQVSDGVDDAVERAKNNAVAHFQTLDYNAVGSDVRARFSVVIPNARAAFARAGSNFEQAAVAQMLAIQMSNAGAFDDAARPSASGSF